MREHHAGFQLVSLTDGARTTVRVFLSALKLFYRVMRAQTDTDTPTPWLMDRPRCLPKFRIKSAAAISLPRIPEVSGVVHPASVGSDSYFKLVGETWIPQVIDDPELPARVLSGGQSIGWRLQNSALRAFFSNPDAASPKWWG